jgi:uncharacterized protein with HEPN domain
MSRDDAWLLDMAMACRSILEFRQGLDREGFLADRKTQSAVIHQLTILGEAAKRVSAALRQTAPDVPWSLVAGMRDHLIHGYQAVDLEEVWRTVDRDVPALIGLLERLVTGP